MGFLDKVKFWKREDDFDFDKIAQRELKSGDLAETPDILNTPPPGFEEKSVFDELSETAPSRFAATPQPRSPSPRESFSSQGVTGPNRDLELINSKLDTIKALLASLEQRLASIERATGSQPAPKQQQRLW